MNRRHWLQLSGAATAAHLSGCRRRRPTLDMEVYREDVSAALKNHAEVCAALYRIAWQKTDILRGQIELFLAQPDARGWAGVRDSWTGALLAYMETEGLRGFSTPADSYQSRIEAWPVDPAKLDAVPGQPKSGIVHDTAALPQIDAEALLEVHEPRTGNVLIGFHAIEFLIYGVDLYEDGGGYRAFTDYTRAAGAERRRDLLMVLANLLSEDVKHLADAWHPAQQDNYREQFMQKTPSAALSVIFTGLTSVCANGLDGKLTRPLKSGDEKDEVCRFSDVSLDAIRHAVLGLQKTLSGEAPGRVLEGEEKPLLGLLAKADPALPPAIESGFTALLAELEPLDQPFDQLILPGNPGRAVLERAVVALENQHELLQDAARALHAEAAVSA